jgi:amidase
MGTGTEFREDLEQYFATLQNTSLRTLADVVDYNNAHGSVEMPPGFCCQGNLLAALNASSSDAPEYKAAKESARRNSRENGIDYALERYNVSAIFVPAEGPSSVMPALAGYPIATAPLGLLEDQQKPFGVAFFATAEGEDVLLRILAAWEETMPTRRGPVMEQWDV